MSAIQSPNAKSSKGALIEVLAFFLDLFLLDISNLVIGSKSFQVVAGEDEV